MPQFPRPGRAASCELMGLIFASLATLVLAQRGQGAAIRVDPDGVLRTGPLSRVPGERADIVNILPEAFPKELLPEGAVLVTGAVSPSLTVVVASLPKEPTFYSWRLQWALEDRGWISSTPSRGGFTPAGSSAPFMMVCRGADFAEFGVFTQPDGGRLLRISIGPDGRRGCTPRGFGSTSDLPIPVVVLPPGVRPLGSGGGGSMDDWETRARLETTLAPTTLSADFAKQLEADGWTRQGPTVGDDVMQVTRLQHRTRAGDPVTALLLVTRLGDSGAIDAVIRFVRHKSSR